MNNISEKDFPEQVNNARELAEMVAKLHYTVSTSANTDICFYQSPIYENSQNLLKAAIKTAYPDLDEDKIYDVWVDCGESIAYCANHVLQENRRERDEVDWYGKDTHEHKYR